jgi:hypothetical protein
LTRIEDLVSETNNSRFMVELLWLKAEMDPSTAHQALEEALALCAVPDNDRFASLRRQTEIRLAALAGEEGSTEQGLAQSC